MTAPVLQQSGIQKKKARYLPQVGMELLNCGPNAFLWYVLKLLLFMLVMKSKTRTVNILKCHILYYLFFVKKKHSYDFNRCIV